MAEDEYIPLSDTPEWKEARRLRGKPRGRHIKSSGPDMPVEYTREELFAQLLKLQEEDMVISGVKFDRSISLGAVAGIMMTLLSWGGAYGLFTRWQGDIENRIATNRDLILANQKGDEDRSKRYVPQIEAMQRITDSSVDRFSNVASAISQLRDIVTDLSKTVAQTHEEIMVLKARMGYDKRTELEPPAPDLRKAH